MSLLTFFAAESFLIEVMREELGAFHDILVCAFDKALFFNTHAVELFAVERARMPALPTASFSHSCIL